MRLKQFLFSFLATALIGQTYAANAASEAEAVVLQAFKPFEKDAEALLRKLHPEAVEAEFLQISKKQNLAASETEAGDDMLARLQAKASLDLAVKYFTSEGHSFAELEDWQSNLDADLRSRFVVDLSPSALERMQKLKLFDDLASAPVAIYSQVQIVRVQSALVAAMNDLLWEDFRALAGTQGGEALELESKLDPQFFLTYRNLKQILEVDAVFRERQSPVVAQLWRERVQASERNFGREGDAAVKAIDSLAAPYLSYRLFGAQSSLNWLKKFYQPWDSKRALALVSQPLTAGQMSILITLTKIENTPADQKPETQIWSAGELNQFEAQLKSVQITLDSGTVAELLKLAPASDKANWINKRGDYLQNDVLNSKFGMMSIAALSLWAIWRLTVKPTLISERAWIPESALNTRISINAKDSPSVLEAQAQLRAQNGATSDLFNQLVKKMPIEEAQKWIDHYTKARNEVAESRLEFRNQYFESVDREIIARRLNVEDAQMLRTQYLHSQDGSGFARRQVRKVIRWISPKWVSEDPAYLNKMKAFDKQEKALESEIRGQLATRVWGYRIYNPMLNRRLARDFHMSSSPKFDLCGRSLLQLSLGGEAGLGGLNAPAPGATVKPSKLPSWSGTKSAILGIAALVSGAVAYKLASTGYSEKDRLKDADDRFADDKSKVEAQAQAMGYQLMPSSAPQTKAVELILPTLQAAIIDAVKGQDIAIATTTVGPISADTGIPNFVYGVIRRQDGEDSKLSPQSQALQALANARVGVVFRFRMQRIQKDLNSDQVEYRWAFDGFAPIRPTQNPAVYLDGQILRVNPSTAYELLQGSQIAN